MSRTILKRITSVWSACILRNRRLWMAMRSAHSHAAESVDGDVAAYIAFGSNMGNRVQNVNRAMRQLKEIGKVVQTSFLYESEAMYKTDQPNYLNGVVKLSVTGDNKSPEQLLHQLKQIEASQGRDIDSGQRNHPRPIDLDILMIGDAVMKSSQLEIPHPRLHERRFVLQPFSDVADAGLVVPRYGKTLSEMLSALGEEYDRLVRVTPVLNDCQRLIRWGKRTMLMGILNMTPDSFSDGGQLLGNAQGLSNQLDRFAGEGFDIIDIGGQSTRPGAAPVSTDEELRRVLPVVDLVKSRYGEDLLISVDTFNERVAAQALRYGAHIVNDVTACQYGRNAAMAQTMAEHGAVAVVMHMRGTPQTMTQLTNYVGDNDTAVIATIGQELKQSLGTLLAHDVPTWNIVTDPGIGFAKTSAQSLGLISNMQHFKTAAGNFPCLLALSRKSWMVKQHVLSGDQLSNEHKDWATAGALASSIAKCGGAVDIVRVHNAFVANAMRACDRIIR